MNDTNFTSPTSQSLIKCNSRDDGLDESHHVKDANKSTYVKESNFLIDVSSSKSIQHQNHNNQKKKNTKLCCEQASFSESDNEIERSLSQNAKSVDDEQNHFSYSDYNHFVNDELSSMSNVQISSSINEHLADSLSMPDILSTEPSNNKSLKSSMSTIETDINSKADLMTMRINRPLLRFQRSESIESLCPHHPQSNESEKNNLKERESIQRSIKIVLCASDDAYVVFLKTHKCFELMPTSGKVLVLDSSLSIKKAFYALVYNNTRAALVSTPSQDSGLPIFTGVLSISDFIELATLYYRSKHNKIKELEQLTIQCWKNQLCSKTSKHPVSSTNKGTATRYLVNIPPTMTLFDTCVTIENERVHRVPIINPLNNDFLYFVTLKRILRFLFLAIYNIPRPSFLDKTIEELGIGTYCTDCIATVKQANTDSTTTKLVMCDIKRTYKKIHTITYKTKVIDALRLLVKTGVSALPVVDITGRLRDLFSRFDVIHLAVAGSYSALDRSVADALRKRKKRIEVVLSCHVEETLITIMVRMVTRQVHRLVIVDKTRRVIGILSLSDLMNFLTRHEK